MRPGLADPVLDSQRIFRGVMDAMAHPGRIVPLPPPPDPPGPLVPAAAAVALTLLDYETSLWLDAASSTGPVAEYLRFHCGCPLVTSPGSAAFALLADAECLPGLDAFDAGSDEFPDRSATVIVQVAGLRAGTGHWLRGPGIDGARRLEIQGMPERFWSMCVENHARFPRGIDFILVADSRVVALPRTTLTAEA